jgi:hypothetical protein
LQKSFLSFDMKGVILKEKIHEIDILPKWDVTNILIGQLQNIELN